jgi:GxxExxY protein
MSDLDRNLTEVIIGCAMRVHRTLGPGLLESAYKACLYYELLKAGLSVEQEKALPLIYHDVKLDCGYRVDFLVEGSVLVEAKSVQSLNDIHLAQTLTYLKLLKVRTGLLINFNVRLLKDGIKRVANGFEKSSVNSVLSVVKLHFE